MREVQICDDIQQLDDSSKRPPKPVQVLNVVRGRGFAHGIQ